MKPTTETLRTTALAFGMFALATALLAAMKLFGGLALPWLVVFFPISIPFTVIGICAVITFFAAATSARHRMSTWR